MGAELCSNPDPPDFRPQCSFSEETSPKPKSHLKLLIPLANSRGTVAASEVFRRSHKELSTGSTKGTLKTYTTVDLPAPVAFCVGFLS